jgi:hypothetical protein
LIVYLSFLNNDKLFTLLNLQPLKSILNRRRIYIFIGLFVISGAIYAQQKDITISGNAVNSNGLGGLYQVIVINQRTSTGMLAEPNGHFTINCQKTDTILVSASGFSVKKICFLDSVYKSVYTFTVVLDSMHYSLAEVKIYLTKSLREVNEERNSLGNIPKTDKYQDINAIGSPIEYLYERFSRLEQSKRKVAQLEDEERRREVLKELFQIYIRHDIINLTDTEFDNFIDYCNFTDNFIKNSTDYDLVMAIKARYEQFEKAHDYVSPFRK